MAVQVLFTAQRALMGVYLGAPMKPCIRPWHGVAPAQRGGHQCPRVPQTQTVDLYRPGDLGLNTNWNLRVPSQSSSLLSCKMEKRHRVSGTVLTPESAILILSLEGPARPFLVDVRPRRTWGWGRHLHGDQSGSWVGPKRGHFCMW